MGTGQAKEMVQVFRALGVAKRLEIVQFLAKHSLCVGALAHLLDISAGAVSQHLRVLRDAGLVEPDRRGYYTHYSLPLDAARRCRAVMESVFGSKEGGGPCAVERRSVRGRKPCKASRRSAPRSR
jgi:DNA-binding transcriptional ArsR family regulator